MGALVKYGGRKLPVCSGDILGFLEKEMDVKGLL